MAGRGDLLGDAGFPAGCLRGFRDECAGAAAERGRVAFGDGCECVGGVDVHSVQSSARVLSALHRVGGDDDPARRRIGDGRGARRIRDFPGVARARWRSRFSRLFQRRCN